MQKNICQGRGSSGSDDSQMESLVTPSCMEKEGLLLHTVITISMCLGLHNLIRTCSSQSLHRGSASTCYSNNVGISLCIEAVCYFLGCQIPGHTAASLQTLVNQIWFSYGNTETKLKSNSLETPWKPESKHQNPSRIPSQKSGPG